MPKIRIYHVKALLLTYLVWAALNLLLAYSTCEASPFRYPVTQVLYFWALLQHILPLWALWDNSTGGLSWVVLVVAGSCVVAGLLIERRRGRFLVIAGMSLWFLWASMLFGISA